MLPVEFDQKNFTYQKPGSMTDEQCGSLDVFKGNDADGQPVIISKWMPNKEDIEAINKGEGIWLWIIGEGMPPVIIATENPFVVNQ